MEAIKERVEKALEKIRPYLVADGGDIAPEIGPVNDGPPVV